MQTQLIGFRKFKNLTQQEMADLIDVDIRTYINKESGSTEFKMNEMFKISEKLNAPIELIFLPTNFMSHEEKA